MTVRALLHTGALLVLLALAACAAQPAPEAQPQSGNASTQPTAPAPQPSPAGELVATLQRSGGIAGATETFVVQGDGTVAVGLTTRQAEGGAEAAADLANRIAATGIYDVAPGQYMPANTCCDRYTYDLTLVRDGQRYHYVTMDGAENAPPALMETISLIQQYVASAH